MPRRLLLVLAGLGAAGAALLMSAGPAHGLTLAPLASVTMGPLRPVVPPVPPVPPLPPVALPVPPPPALPIVGPVVGQVVNQVGAALPSDRAQPAAPPTSRAPQRRAAPSARPSAGAAAGARVWRDRAMPAAYAPQARAPVISSSAAPPDPLIAVLRDPAADRAANPPNASTGQPFALHPSSVAIVNARPTLVVFSRAPPLRSGFLVGGGRPG